MVAERIAGIQSVPSNAPASVVAASDCPGSGRPLFEAIPLDDDGGNGGDSPHRLTSRPWVMSGRGDSGGGAGAVIRIGLAAVTVSSFFLAGTGQTRE